MSISSLPVYNGYFAASRKRAAQVSSGAPSRFDYLMARNSRPISGRILSVGGRMTPEGYRVQRLRNAAPAVDDMAMGDLGVDASGNQVPLEPLNLPAAPEFTMPQVDENAVDTRTQSVLAPMLSRLRNALNKSIVTNKNVDNVNVRKMLNRGAIRGYGEGLSAATGTARNQGRRDYMSMDYQPKVNAAGMNYQAKVNRNRMIAQDMINRRSAAMSRAYRRY